MAVKDAIVNYSYIILINHAPKYVIELENNIIQTKKFVLWMSFNASINFAMIIGM